MLDSQLKTNITELDKITHTKNFRQFYLQNFYSVINLFGEAAVFAGYVRYHKQEIHIKKYTERLILTAVKETKTQKTKYVKQKMYETKFFLLCVFRLLCLRFFNCRKDQSFRMFFFYFKCFTDPGLLKIRQLSTPCRCGLSSLKTL